MDISNLSAGGTPVDVGEVMHQRWRDLAVRVARIFDLRICGLIWRVRILRNQIANTA